jgi:subtilisin
MARRPTALRGVAPGARIRAYRVFGAGGGGATNYAILKAMIFAASDKCDIVNLSLGGHGPHDPIVEEAVRDARNQGMLVVVATGNDDRAAVSYPAAYNNATAVTAMGREGTFPAGSLDEAEIVRPPVGTDPDEFIAGFSNVGTEVAATAPGVGALSTIFGDRFGAMSGTSMAAPVLSGAVACLLSRDAAVFGMTPREAARSDAIEDLLNRHSKALNFGAVYEGNGMPDPAKV